MTSSDLRAQAQLLHADAQTLFDQFKAAPDGMPEAEAARYDQLLDRRDSLLARAKEFEAREQRLAAGSESLTSVEARVGSTIETKAIAAAEGRGVGKDSQLTIGDFMRNVAIVADRAVDRRTLERAQERLANGYGSAYNAWDSAERGAETRTLVQNTGISGGYTVPVGFYKELLQVASENAIVRPRAFVLPMEADEVLIPVLDQTTAQTAGDTPYFGGIKGTWSGEARTINETEPKFRQDRLIAYELTGYTELSRTLIQNSALALDAIVRQLFGKAVAWYEDYAFLRGNGQGKPIGAIASGTALATSARGSASAISFADAINVWASVHPQSMSANGAWVVSQNALGKLLSMTGTSNSVMVPAGYFSPNAAQAAVAMYLLGKPVLVSEKLPALNTLGDFGYFDFSQYVIGDRQSLEVAASEHFKFQNNVIAYRFVHRVAGMPWQNAPITIADGSTKVSPFVLLGAA